MNFGISLRQAFSLRKNLKSIFICDSKRCRPVDGLRALALLVLIAFHMVWLGPKDWLGGSYQHLFIGLLKGSYALDVYFVISGYLITELLLIEFAKTGTIPIFKFYLRRCLRLMPVHYCFLLILFFISTGHHQTLWASILYVQNYIPLNQQFMPWAWSLAVEMQFYLLFPWVLLVMLRYPRYFLWILLGMWIVAMLVGAMVVIKTSLELPFPMLPLLSSELPLNEQWLNAVYLPLYMHLTPFMYGIGIAYIQYYHRNWLFNFLQRQSISMLLFLAIFAIFIYIFNPPQPSPTTAITMATYLIFSKNIFALAIALLLLLTLYPKQKLNQLIGWFLSWRIWYVIANLSYSAFIIHPLFITVVFLFYIPHMADVTVVMKCVIWVYGLTFFSSLLIYVLLEKPLMSLRGYFSVLNLRRRKVVEFAQATPLNFSPQPAHD